MTYYPPTKQLPPKGLRILCVKWGDKYGEEYVYKLQAACQRHIPHKEFVCLTDNPVEGVMCNPLPSNLPSWWSKVGMFQRGLFPGKNLYLDLDVVVTGSINPLIAVASGDYLYAPDDFSYSLINPKRGMDAKTRELLGGAGTINSSVMLWNGTASSKVYRIWDEFNDAVMDELHGDQNHITRTLWPDDISLLPKGYVKSYKYHPGEVAPVVVFHGEPKPADVSDEWVRVNWAA